MSSKKLKPNDTSMDGKFDYDLIVLGGGSGGMAAAKEAARIRPEIRVALFDYVSPSPNGTTWGLGGTCVNVGCIPKKLMHIAGSSRHAFERARSLGWKVSEQGHDWKHMVTEVTNYIRSLNFAFRNQLRSAKIEYINAEAHFVDQHTVKYTISGEEKTLSASKFIVSTGGRPRYPDIPGANLALSSDDIFWRKESPGKTLVIGGSYIALECAGFLHELGYDVSVMVRSILLRGFDQQCANQIGENMERTGVRFIRPATPDSLERKGDSGPITVTWTSNGTKTQEEFDTVLFAIGRSPNTKIGLANIGVTLDGQGFIDVDEFEQSSVSNIYAVGDVITSSASATKRPELTPVAIQAGQLLSRRLFGSSQMKMNYGLVPTTVFTPSEYGAVGMSHDEAVSVYGADNVVTYVSRYSALEDSTIHEDEPPKPRSFQFIDQNLWARQHFKTKGKEWEDFKEGSYDYTDRAGQYKHNNMLAKLVCDKTTGRVVGLHYVGESAGEIVQGFALAMHYGATKEAFDQLVGIHPTSAEEFTVIETTLESGDDFMKKEGCGGGGACG